MKKLNPSQPWQSIAAAAEITGLSQYYIRSGCIDGSICHVKTGRKYLVHVPTLLAKMEALAGVNEA